MARMERDEGKAFLRKSHRYATTDWGKILGRRGLNLQQGQMRAKELGENAPPMLV